MRRALRWGSLAVGLLAVALVVLAARHAISQAAGDLGRVSAGAFAAAAVLVLVGTGLTVFIWRAVLEDLGVALPIRPCVQVFFLGQLGKYVPGSVWPVVAQMQLAGRHGVERSRAAAASVVSMVLSLVVGLLVAAVALPLGHPAALLGYGWAFLALPVGVLVLSPPVLNRLLGRLLHLARRPPLERPLSLPGVGRAAGWSAVSWSAQGASVWVLTRALGARGGSTFALAVGAFALAWVVGFLVVFAPAGGVAREGALTLLLAPALAAGPALAVALLSRLLFTVADLLWGAVAVVGGRRGGSPAPGPVPAPAPDPAPAPAPQPAPPAPARW